jgi:hypothetical protein
VRSGRSEIAVPPHATHFIHLAPVPSSYHARGEPFSEIATWRERWRNRTAREHATARMCPILWDKSRLYILENAKRIG